MNIGMGSSSLSSMSPNNTQQSASNGVTQSPMVPPGPGAHLQDDNRKVPRPIGTERAWKYSYPSPYGGSNSLSGNVLDSSEQQWMLENKPQMSSQWIPPQQTNMSRNQYVDDLHMQDYFQVRTSLNFVVNRKIAQINCISLRFSICRWITQIRLVQASQT